MDIEGPCHQLCSLIHLTVNSNTTFRYFGNRQRRGRMDVYWARLAKVKGRFAGRTDANQLLARP